ncbi:MAG: cellulose synthase operon protein YhjQ [Myxococcota bacterium]|jgi:cellulose synthase operon protein YhjQ
MATVITMMSLKGGTGRTTLAANLASVLTQNRRACFALDLDPQNSLGLHFGMPPGEQTGISWKGVNRSHVNDFRHRNRARVPILPFGQCSARELADLEDEMHEDPYWLHRAVDRLTPDDCQFVILDTPGYGVWMEQAVRVADLVLVSMLPDGASFATLPATEQFLARHCAEHEHDRRWYYLINQSDGRTTLGRDAVDAARDMLGRQVLPITIPYDSAVPEALTRQRPLIEEAPGSQVLRSLWSLAEWMANSQATQVSRYPQLTTSKKSVGYLK